MEVIRKRLSYYDFSWVTTSYTGDTLFELQQIVNNFGLSEWNEAAINYPSFVTGFLTAFPDNFIPFATSSGFSANVTVVTTAPDDHGLVPQERVAMYFTAGQTNATGVYTVTVLGNQLGGNPTDNFLLVTPFTTASQGYLCNLTDEALSFFKGFNVQPTAQAINVLQPYVERYFTSPDLKSLASTAIGEFFSFTPRRVFNELEFVFQAPATYSSSTIPTQWGYLSGTTISITGTPVVNLTVFLTQSIENLGIYENFYTGDTDTRFVNILADGSPLAPAVGTTNNLPYYFNDGLNHWGYAYTGVTDFYETLYSWITGTTEDKSFLISSYKDLTADQKGDAIPKYKLALSPDKLTYTLERNTVIGVNADNKVEYTTSRPITQSSTSTFKVKSHGLHPLNGNVYTTTGLTAASAVLYKDANEGLVQRPNYVKDVFIDRGVFSVFENQYKIPLIKTLEDLESFENGEFNVIKQP